MYGCSLISVVMTEEDDDDDDDEPQMYNLIIKNVTLTDSLVQCEWTVFYEVPVHRQWICSTLYISVDFCISLYFTVIISSDTEDVKKNLTGTVGGSITLPDPVVEVGFFLFGPNIIALVTERKVQIVDKIYDNRLHWNKSTGLFTFTGLQRNDSGIYKIESKKGNSVIVFYKLTVYGKSYFLCQCTDQCVGGSIALRAS